MDRHHGSGNGYRSVLPRGALRKRALEVEPECPLVAVRRHQLAVPQGRYLLEQLVSGQRRLPMMQMVIENHGCRVRYGLQWISRAVRHMVVELPENAIVVCETIPSLDPYFRKKVLRLIPAASANSSTEVVS